MTMKFKYDVSTKDNYVVVELSGRIGGEASLHMYQEIKSLLEQYPGKNLILDFRGVDFLDSSGLGALVAVNSTLLKTGREMILTSISSNISELLKITNLFKVLRTAKTINDV